MMIPSAPPRPPRDLPAFLAEPRRFAAMIAIAFVLTSVGLLAAPRTTLGWDVNNFNSSSEAQLVRLTNQARASAGLKALKVDSRLTAIARSRSKDMIVRNYFSHTILGTNYNVFHLLDKSGYCYRIAGENIGWNNYPDDVATNTVERQFMGSPGHRANILGKAWDVVGIGAYKGPTGKKMWTVLFADKCGSTAPKPTPRPTAKPRPKPKPTPRPTARPTPRPTPHKTKEPKATPAPTPVPETPDAAATPPLDASDLIPIDDTGDAATDGTEPPSDQSATDGTTEAAVRMRVIDRPPNGGLLDTIVGGVTGFFFGG
jgi:uncharacterized protein YkwD